MDVSLPARPSKRVRWQRPVSFPRPQGFRGALDRGGAWQAGAGAGCAEVLWQSGHARLKLTGVTGTNGKTTTTFLIDAVLRAAGMTTALVGTIEYRLANEVRPAVNTTPESLDLYRLFHELEQAGRNPCHNGGFIPRAGVGTCVRDWLSHCCIYEPHAGSPGFPPHDGRLFRGQAPAVRARR